MPKRLFSPWFGTKLFGMCFKVLVLGLLLFVLIMPPHSPNAPARLCFIIIGLMPLVFGAQMYSFWHGDARRILETQGALDYFRWWLTTIISAPLAWFGLQRIILAIKGIASGEMDYL